MPDYETQTLNILDPCTDMLVSSCSGRQQKAQLHGDGVLQCPICCDTLGLYGEAKCLNEMFNSVRGHAFTSTFLHCRRPGDASLW